MTQSQTLSPEPGGGGIDIGVLVAELGDPEERQVFWASVYVPELIGKEHPYAAKTAAEYGLVTMLISAPSEKRAIDGVLGKVTEMLGTPRHSSKLVAIKEILPDQAQGLIDILKEALE